MNNIDVNSKRKNPCWLLVKNRLTAQLGINVFRYEKDTHKRNSKIATTVALIICLLMILGYCGGMAFGYAHLGLTELIPGIALVISSLITMFFTMFKANGELFGFKDYDMVMSLPVPVRTIISSRFLNMYIWNTFITLLVMLPMGVVYAYYIVPSIGFYIMWLMGIFLTCLIPTTVAAIFGAVITAISSKFRYASAISTLLSIVFIVAIMLLPMLASTENTGLGEIFDKETGDIDKEAFATLAPVISDKLNQVYPPVRLFTAAVVQGNIGSFLLFVGISICWYVIFVLLLSLKYRQINTALTSHRSRADYKLEILHQGSMLIALYKKTIKRILKSTICATNLLIGCVLAVLMAVALTIVGPEKMMQSLDASDYMNIVKNAASFCIAALVCMTNTAAISLALEGKNIWLIKSLPIPPKTLYDSYLLTNLTFTVPTSIVCGILFSISLKTGFIGTTLMLLTPLCFSLFTAVFGIFIGNRMAYYNWQEEIRLIKQSVMGMIAMLGGMVFIIICGVIANIGILPFSANMITFIIDILILMLAAVIYLHESNRPVKE
ncbi:MAG TPA: hypothetical protein VJZ06_09960 [Mobilitalea sp.]|nr:hypothetical protein [Mobilitalea sp.]